METLAQKYVRKQHTELTAHPSIRAGRSLCRALCSGYVVNGVGLEEKISRSLNVVIELQANKSRTREVITIAKIGMELERQRSPQLQYWLSASEAATPFMPLLQ